jgi:class 3 adenylate cyclase
MLGGALRLSLKFKLSLLIMVLLTAAVVAVSAFLLQQQQQALTAEMTKRGHAIAQHLAAGARNALLVDDELALNVLVNDAMNDPDVAYIAIADHDGRARAHSDVALVGHALERPARLAPLGEATQVQTYVSPRHGPVIDFSVPLTFRDVGVGAVYVGFSQASMHRALAAARRYTAGITAVMLAVGIAGAVALASLMSRPIRRLMAGTRRIAEGDFTVNLAIASRDEIGALTEAFNQMARSLGEKEHIKRAFTRYVAREVVDQILKDPERLVLTGERREVTVLFCDVRGFTRMAERLPPEDVVALLNNFYDLMIDTIFRYQGTVDKFLGDGVMAVFGAPIYRDDHAVQAVRAALQMQAGIQALSARLVSEGKQPIAVGIGVNAGEAIAGTVGTDERMEYTVIGDNVNLAARLESSALPGQILISEQTLRMVEDQVMARSLGRIKVKGKQDEVGVYEVLSATPALARGAA